jgi:hypothetical protein
MATMLQSAASIAKAMLNTQEFESEQREMDPFTTAGAALRLRSAQASAADCMYAQELFAAEAAPIADYK